MLKTNSLMFAKAILGNIWEYENVLEEKERTMKSCFLPLCQNEESYTKSL